MAENSEKVNVNLMKEKVADLSIAVTEEAHKLKILPLGCEYRCQVQIGSDGRPTLVCGIVCD